MQKYTVGFLFSEDLMNVILIEKRRPDWQAGKINGVGGHVEENEDPKDCMIREFKEEAGVEIKDWTLFATITDEENWMVYFFRSIVPIETFNSCETQTDEKIVKLYLGDHCLPKEIIENLKWLIPLALSRDMGIPLYIKERTINDMRLL